MATCYLWVTLLSSQTADVLIAGLVNHGFTVAPLACTGKTVEVGEISTLAALKIEGVEPVKHGEETTAPQHVVLNAAKKILGTYSYYSIVSLCLGGSVTWTGGNMKLPEAPDYRKNALERVGGENPLDDAT